MRELRAWFIINRRMPCFSLGTMSLSFSKYTGCGNDFILIDNRSLHFSYCKTWIKNLCARRSGIGADGIVLLEKSDKADYRMRIFNADGSEAEMCGNGLRCLVQFLVDLGQGHQSTFIIETMERNLIASHNGTDVTVMMGKPTEMQWNIKLNVNGQEYYIHYLNTGVPHAVLFLDDIDKVDLEVLGPLFRHHPFFQPAGCNFNIVQLKENGKLAVRTFERGVEDETLACGTGCTASALAARKILGLTSPICVNTRSGDKLSISFTEQKNEFEEVTMCGPAIKVFSGAISRDETLLHNSAPSKCNAFIQF